MLGKQAKILSKSDIKKLLCIASHGRQGIRNRTIILLAVRAGLRASEIAGLTWDMVLDANGSVSTFLDIRGVIAKRQRGRRVPLHPQLFRGLASLKKSSNNLELRAPVITSRQGKPLRSNSVVNWFIVVCRKSGLEGCSSHSGRRTFITLAARNAHKAGASLRDVQLLAGHTSIETTQLYIDGDSDAQRRLVSMIGR